MRTRLLITVTGLSVLLMLNSCRVNELKNLREGEIYFSIKYLSNPSSLPKELLPRELVISFRGDEIRSELKTPIGNSGITSVINPPKNVYDTYLNLLSFKYCFEGTSVDIQPGFASMKGITFDETGKKSIICGFNCRQVEVKIPGENKVRHAWYTTEIKVDQPNRMTPYRDIDGVLMDFFYIIGDAELHFSASEVIARPVPDKYFEKRLNYRKVSGSYLDSLIMKMIAY